MSEQAYVIIAVVGTFIAAAAVAARLIVTSQNRRGATTLEAQLETAGVPYGTRHPDIPVTDRVVKPALSGFGAFVHRLTPAGIRDSIARRLMLAGITVGHAIQIFLAVRVVLTAAGCFLGYYVGVEKGPYVLGALWIAIFGYAAYVAPSHWLDGRVKARQGAIRRDLPDMIDLLTISVEAGLAFDAALLDARRAMSGPLPDEIGRLLHEMQLGASRVDAMRRLSDRTDVEELRSFVLAMVQADTFGVSIANVLRSQSQEMRTKRRQYAEERAMKAPVKLLFPMILCILPSLLVVIVGPGVIRISKLFFT